MSIVDNILKNLNETLNYEIEGVRRRWARRFALLDSIKERISKIRHTLQGQVRITELGKIHYDYEPVITKKAIHY